MMTRLRTNNVNPALRIFLAGTLFAAGLFSFAQNPPNRQNAEQKHEARAAHSQRRPGEWLRKHKDQPIEQQEKELQNDPAFQKLPQERQQALRQRLHQFNDLPPQRKEKVLSRMEAFEQLTPQQRQQARELQGKLKDVPPERRQQMRIALRNLRGMDPQEREKVLNSDEFRGRFSDSEREVLRGLAQIPQPSPPAPAAGSETAPH